MATDTLALPDTPKRRRWSLGRGRKILALGVLFLVSLLPGSLISGIMDERSARQDDVQTEIARAWGPAQDFETPVLVIPYQLADARNGRSYLHIVANHLEANVGIQPEARHHHLFTAIVYTAAIGFKATFVIPAESKLLQTTGPERRFLWDEAFVAVSASRLVGPGPQDGIGHGDGLNAWRGCADVALAPIDCRHPNLLVAPVHVNPPVGTEAAQVPVEGTLSLRGTGSFHLSPVARSFKIHMSGPWADPSFTGNLLPDSAPATSDRGFDADWNGADIALPPLETAGSILNNSAAGRTVVGLDLVEGAPIYRAVDRVSKYEILFLALTFATYFLFETLTGIRIHLVQYGMLGLSVSLFGLLLLSLAEFAGFDLGYAASAALVLLQASLYTFAVTRRRREAGIFAGVLGVLFGFLWVVVGLETYALLTGALALFVALSVIMAVTRRVDWSAEPAAA